MNLPREARILIIRFSSLGDVVKCTGLPRQIKSTYPDAQITVLTGKEFVPLFEHNPHVAQVVGFDRRSGMGGLMALASSLRTERWHLIADVHRSLRSRLLGWFLRGPRTTYSKRTWQRLLLIRFGINTYRPARGKEEDFLAGFAPYGVTNDGGGTELHVKAVGDNTTFRTRLTGPLQQIEKWRAGGIPVVGVAPVAAWDLKRWPLDHFRSLIHQYVERTGGGVIVFGGPGDEGVADVLKEVGTNGLTLVGQTSFIESAYMASLTDCMITNDTGMLHLAEAVGTEVVALFGPTSRELGYFPVRPGSRTLEIALPCRPCTRTGQGTCSHKRHKACLEDIRPESVLVAVMEILGQTVNDTGGRDQR